MLPIADRFFDKVDDTGECWEWTAQLNADGYGRFWDGERMVMAHRWAYEALEAPIPGGLQIDHLCRNTACVNPDHLEPVDNKTNSHRGIQVALRETCNSGRHEWVPGQRRCKPCREESHRENNRRKARQGACLGCGAAIHKRSVRCRSCSVSFNNRKRAA